MQGEVFEAPGDEPLCVIDMGEGYGMISQADEYGQLVTIGTDANRLRAMADYLDRRGKNTDRGSLAV